MKIENNGPLVSSFVDDLKKARDPLKIAAAYTWLRKTCLRRYCKRCRNFVCKIQFKSARVSSFTSICNSNMLNEIIREKYNVNIN